MTGYRAVMARGLPEIEGGAATSPIDFESFFADTHAGLYGALWLVTRNGHEAEEIMQEAYLRLWERWDRSSEVLDLEAYLYRTAMNVFRSRYRRAKVALRRAIGAMPPDEGLARVESRDVVVRALGEISPRQRAAVVLVDLLDFTSEEAGRALGIKAVTVRVLAARGRTSLRERMSEGDG